MGGMMDYETVLKLVEAGFTAEDIRGFAGQQEPQESKEQQEPKEPKEPQEPQEPKEPQEPQEPKEPQEPQEPKEPKGSGYSSDILDALNKQVEKLTKAIQARNIDLNSMGGAGRETLDDVMAHIINNGMGGTNNGR
jgi:pyruvate/2-oxoglutarate dehydrogenase complex dihydrolipoamide acyltransferase (E2) component